MMSTFSMSSLRALVQDVVIQRGGETITGTVNPMEFADMGFMRWPITFCALMVVILAARAAWRMKVGESEQSTLARSTIDGSLFWGAYALVLGVLGTVVGIVVAAQSVEAVGVVEPTLVWGGIKVALSTTIYGLLIFSVAALAWYGLRQWHRRAVLVGG